MMEFGWQRFILGFMGIGAWELALIVLVILLLFGARRLPEIAQGLGKGIREFKKALKETGNYVSGDEEVKPDIKKEDLKKQITDDKQQG